MDPIQESQKAFGFLSNTGTDPTLENHKDVGFLRNTGTDPTLENHKIEGFLGILAPTHPGKSQSYRFSL